MRNLVIMALLVVATIGQSFSQVTTAQINFADREISKAELAFKKAEKSFSSEKAKQLANLNRDLRRTNIAGERADTKAAITEAAAKVKLLKAQIDSVSALTADDNMYEKQQLLNEAKNKKAELQDQFLAVKPNEKKSSAFKADSAVSDSVKLNIKKPANPKKPAKTEKKESGTQPDNIARPPKDPKNPVAKAPKEEPDIYDRRIPTEVSRVSYNRRDRSYDLRREDLLLTKIEQNINSAISPGGQEGGYKVVLDNMYIEPVDFKIFFANGEQYTSVMVDPKTTRVRYLLPGVYFVHFFVDGRESKEPRKLTIDGKTYDYKGQSCFNFAYMPRF